MTGADFISMGMFASLVPARAVGAASALALPLQLASARLPRLLAEPVSLSPARLGDTDAALRAGLFTLRVLARLRLPLWKNTCLYRSALRCHLLRLAGVPAVMRIGARRPEGPSGGLSLHAWVEVSGSAVAEEVESFTPLVIVGARR